eukprot:3491588-Amphidinium_carterae.1
MADDTDIEWLDKYKREGGALRGKETGFSTVTALCEDNLGVFGLRRMSIIAFGVTEYVAIERQLTLHKP